MSLLGLALAAFLTPAAAAHAADTDLVVLDSGNQMTGAVDELARSELTFRIDGAGAVDIDWPNVVGLRSTRLQDIELASGERLRGTVDFTTPGVLEIMTDSGPRSIRMTEIVRMRPRAVTFLDRTSGAVDLGFDFLTAHDEIDWTLNADLEYRAEKYVTDIALSSLVRRHDDETTQQRNHLEVDVYRLLAERWFVVGLFVGEEDLELDLDLRVLVGAAIGRTLVQSQSMDFKLYGGVNVSHEEFSGASVDDADVIELLGAVHWDVFELAADTDVLLKLTAHVKPDDGRTRFELRSSLRRNYSRNFFLSLNLFESYNSDPPAGLEKSDLGLSLTVGRAFR